MSKVLLSGHVFKEVSQQEAKDMDLDIYNHGLVRILPEGWLYPATGVTYLNKFQTMEFRSDDVMVMTFPKCGTTWMQEIVWTMLHNPNLDNPAADEDLWLRSIDMSFDVMLDVNTQNGKAPKSVVEKFERECPGRKEEEGVCFQLLEAAPSPRVIKCHFPLCLLRQDILDKIKVVYVARNPKDMAVSYFHFLKAMSVFPFNLNTSDFFKSILLNQALFSPYWPHVKEAWSKRHHPNLHFVFYEDMKADILGKLKNLNEFLGTRLSKQTLEAVARYTSFTAMKSRGEPINDNFFEKDDEREVKFFRKGEKGDWKNHFSPELQSDMDRWSEENVAGTDLSLSWALAQ